MEFYDQEKENKEKKDQQQKRKCDREIMSLFDFISDCNFNISDILASDWLPACTHVCTSVATVTSKVFAK